MVSPDQTVTSSNSTVFAQNWYFYRDRTTPSRELILAGQDMVVIPTQKRRKKVKVKSTLQL